MQEQLELFLSYAKIVWLKRFLILCIAWPLCIAGWVAVYFLPDQYDASARVYVDTQSLIKPLLRGLTVNVNTTQQIRLMERTLFSRPNVEKIVRITDMDLGVQGEKEYEALVDEVKRSISLQKDKKENLYTIHYTDEDPTLAKSVVQAVLTTFVENTLGENRSGADDAQRFLDKQIQEYEQRLRAAEEKLTQFKRENVDYLSEGDKGSPRP